MLYNLYIYNLCVCFIQMYDCAPCVCLVPLEVRTRALNPLKQVLSLHVGPLQEQGS